eukprot:2000790-Ditylum_brightwellii.AAC.1
MHKPHNNSQNLASQSCAIQSLKRAKLQVVEVLKQPKEAWRNDNKKVAEMHALTGNAMAKQTK